MESSNASREVGVSSGGCGLGLRLHARLSGSTHTRDIAMDNQTGCSGAVGLQSRALYLDGARLAGTQRLEEGAGPKRAHTRL
jgi:hypothetical protein